MKIEIIQIRIRRFMAQFVAEIKGAVAQNDTFLNTLSENILKLLLRNVLDLPNLQNLNQTEKKNFPAIDLADNQARVAIQVTATASNDKIKETLLTFKNHRLYERYDRLIIYVASEKQTRYSGSKYEDIIDGCFAFDKDRDILDYRDILNTVAGFELSRAQAILDILATNLGNDEEKAPSIENIPIVQPIVGEEAVFLNMLSLSFPSHLYIAEMTINREDVIRESKRFSIQLNSNSSDRDVVRAALEQHDLSFSVDWITYENKIATFHDLSNPDLPLYHMIDPGTVDCLPTSAFYGIDENYERMFKQLLRLCTQQLLFNRDVYWQHEERLFIFVRLNSDVRQEQWYGTKYPLRTVYECERNPDNPEKIWKHIHFGFRTTFKRFGEDWYIVLTPDWFVSYDGYKKSYYGEEFIKYKKRKETNQHVNTHVRFIAHFLKNHHATLFDAEYRKYTFLTFGEFVQFDNAPFLDDKAYLPDSKKEKKKNLMRKKQKKLI